MPIPNHCGWCQSTAAKFASSPRLGPRRRGWKLPCISARNGTAPPVGSAATLVGVVTAQFRVEAHVFWF